MNEADKETDQQADIALKGEPTTRIHPRAVGVWRIGGGFSSLFYWLIPLIIYNMDWDTLMADILVYGLAGVVVVNTILQFTILPYLRWKRWRYQVDQNEIDLKRGVFVVMRTLVPVKRIQHVDTRQGPLFRFFRLSTITISTAATTHEIPALGEQVAEELRNEISEYARIAREEDV